MNASTGGIASHLPLLSMVLSAILVGILFTAYLMRKNRRQEYGHVKGVAVDPEKVIRDNPPDA